MMRRGVASRLALAIALAVLCACSNQQAYEGLRQRNLQECYRLPQGELERCLERNDVDYEEYRRQREEVLEAPDAQP